MMFQPAFAIIYLFIFKDLEFNQGRLILLYYGWCIKKKNKEEESCLDIDQNVNIHLQNILFHLDLGIKRVFKLWKRFNYLNVYFYFLVRSFHLVSISRNLSIYISFCLKMKYSLWCIYAWFWFVKCNFKTIF